MTNDDDDDERTIAQLNILRYNMTRSCHFVVSTASRLVEFNPSCKVWMYTF